MNQEQLRLINEYFELRREYDEQVGNKFRYQIKRKYQEVVDRLWLDLPDHYRFDGKVLVKGFDRNFGRRYLQIFSESSYARAQRYLQQKQLDDDEAQNNQTTT